MSPKHLLFTVLFLAYCAKMGKAVSHKQQMNFNHANIMSCASTACRNDAKKFVSSKSTVNCYISIRF